MQIAATVRNTVAGHETSVSTDDDRRSLAVAGRSTGRGSSVNGGEFLMLALATCYCNDLYREAGRLAIPIDGVEVEASATFPGPGLAAVDIRYRARVESTASPEAIARLLDETDAVAEVHNTIRGGARVEREPA